MKFDLNIDNYTIEDILDIFDLTENYDANMLDIKEIKMRDNIMRSTELGQHDVDRTIQFIQDAKLILMNAKDNNNASTTTTATATIATTGTMNNLLSSFENNASKYTPLKDESEHMVQDKKNNGNYISSYPSSFFNGVINPLMKKVRYMNINIDSRFRSNYYSQSSSNFNANIAEQINGVLTMQLQSIELPTTFYTISKQLDNNYFYIDLPNTNDSGLVEIQEGNYDYSGIEDAINTALTNLGGDYANIVFKINSTDNSNGVGNGSGRMLVGLSSTPIAPIPSDFKYSLNFQKSKAGLENDLTALPLKLGWLLGFRNGKYTDNLNYASEGVVDLLGLKYMYLSIDDYNNNVNNSFHSAFTSSLLNKNILARISIKSGTTNIISQDNLNITTTPREYYGPVNINNLHVQLLDPYGRAVDLNNMDYSFCLTLQLVYDL
tara:strand:- start:943 stop:2250 length:1308 start_codon:yes stop_codon:yes gene_type:complete